MCEQAPCSSPARDATANNDDIMLVPPLPIEEGGTEAETTQKQNIASSQQCPGVLDPSHVDCSFKMPGFESLPWII